MNSGAVYIVGGGLAGLSAAVFLAEKGTRAQLFEAAGFAGGRCRSYHEPALGQTVDNGNHLILSGNHAAWDYLRKIGSEKNFVGPRNAEFAFADIKSGARWTIRPNDGPIPWWTLSQKRRVPGTHMTDYLRLAKLLRAGIGQRLGVSYPCRGILWEQLIHPFLLAALNTEPETASAKLVAAVMAETLAKGGKAYRPSIASPTLAAAFIDPAVAFVKNRGSDIRFGHRLHTLAFGGQTVSALELAGSATPVAPHQSVILAVPASVAVSLVPGLVVPDEFRAIVSGHFRVVPPPSAPPMTGVLGATVEWIFCFPDRISVTVSNADRLIDMDRMDLAEILWRETAQVLGLPDEIPPWQVVKEKRATFAATPEQEVKRPGAVTDFANLFLAGDWTDTGLPATIEGAIRSGRRAAELALARARV